MKKSQQGEKEEEELGDREERNGVKTEFLKMLIFLKYKNDNRYIYCDEIYTEV